MKQNSKPDSEMLKLSRAITKALLKSEEVLSILTRLRNEKRLKTEALIAFVLKANDLLNVSMKTQDSGKSTFITRKPNGLLIPAVEKKGTYIDGKKLTDSEFSFQEFLSERFNEDAWLKRNNLKYDDNTL